jgi:hypothetical protein
MVVRRLLVLASGFGVDFGLDHTAIVVVPGCFGMFQGWQLMAMERTRALTPCTTRRINTIISGPVRPGLPCSTPAWRARCVWRYRHQLEGVCTENTDRFREIGATLPETTCC